MWEHGGRIWGDWVRLSSFAPIVLGLISALCFATGIQLTRSSLLLACTVFYFVALRYIELPTAAAINFTAPILVTLLAIPMLGEKVPRPPTSLYFRSVRLKPSTSRSSSTCSPNECRQPT